MITIAVLKSVRDHVQWSLCFLRHPQALVYHPWFGWDPTVSVVYKHIYVETFYSVSDVRTLVCS